MTDKFLKKIITLLLIFTLHSCSVLKITVDNDKAYQYSENQSEKEIDDLLNQYEKLIIVLFNFNKNDKFHLSDYKYNYTDGIIKCEIKNYVDPCKIFYVANGQDISLSINNNDILIPQSFVTEYKYLYIDLSDRNGSKKYKLNFSNHWKTKFDDESTTIIKANDLEKIYQKNIKPTKIVR